MWFSLASVYCIVVINKFFFFFFFWLAATASTPTPLMDPADWRRYTLQHLCWMVQGSSSWPLWVDATDLCCLRDLMMMMMMMTQPWFSLQLVVGGHWAEILTIVICLRRSCGIRLLAEKLYQSRRSYASLKLFSFSSPRFWCPGITGLRLHLQTCHINQHLEGPSTVSWQQHAVPPKKNNWSVYFSTHSKKKYTRYCLKEEPLGIADTRFLQAKCRSCHQTTLSKQENTCDT